MSIVFPWQRCIVVRQVRDNELLRRCVHRVHFRPFVNVSAKFLGDLASIPMCFPQKFSLQVRYPEMYPC